MQLCIDDLGDAKLPYGDRRVAQMLQRYIHRYHQRILHLSTGADRSVHRNVSLRYERKCRMCAAALSVGHHPSQRSSAPGECTPLTEQLDIRREMAQRICTAFASRGLSWIQDPDRWLYNVRRLCLYSYTGTSFHGHRIDAHPGSGYLHLHQVIDLRSLLDL